MVARSRTNIAFEKSAAVCSQQNIEARIFCVVSEAVVQVVSRGVPVGADSPDADPGAGAEASARNDRPSNRARF